MADPDPLLGRRLKAARAYAGYTSVEKLADALNQPRFGVKTLRAIEQGHRDPNRMELMVIAEECDVPVSFLESGFEGSAADQRLDRVEALLRELLGRVSQRPGDGERLPLAGGLGRDAQGNGRTPPRPGQGSPEQEEERKRGTAG